MVESEYNSFIEEQEEIEELEEGEELEDDETIPFGGENERYWNNRYRLFSRFDEGIKMDKGKANLYPPLTQGNRRMVLSYSRTHCYAHCREVCLRCYYRRIHRYYFLSSFIDSKFGLHLSVSLQK